MLGLMYLIVATIYLLIMIQAVSAAWRNGLAAGSRKRAWIYGTLAFLAFYLPAFWDHLPTLLAQKYYCAKDGGTHIYEDPKVWLEEHKAQIKNLSVVAGGEAIDQLLPDGWERVYLANKIVAKDSLAQRINIVPGIVLIGESSRLVDITNGKTLASRKEYVTPTKSTDLKFWLHFSGCSKEFLEQWTDAKTAYSIYLKQGERE